MRRRGGYVLCDSRHCSGESGRHAWSPGRMLHRRRHRAEAGGLFHAFAVSLPLREKGPLFQLCRGGADFRNPGPNTRLARPRHPFSKCKMIDMDALIDSIGVVAGLLTTTAFIPQVWKIYRTKSGKDISGRMISLFTTGLVLWLIYGIILRSLPLILSNAVTLVLSLAIIVLKIRYRNRIPLH